MLFQILILIILTLSYSKHLRCSKNVNDKIIKVIKRYHSKNNTIILSNVYQSVMNKTGFPEEFIKKCIGV
jgi:hypothetical protein